MKAIKWLCVIWLSAALLAGCATDGPGDMNADREDPNACSNPCEAGETRCAGTVIEACGADVRGCLNWSSGVDCAADGTMCDDTAEPAICLTEPGTCQDGALNQDESDIDCGGLRCVACGLGDTCNAAADCETNNCDLGNTGQCVPEDQPTCSDGEHNQDESDVDCGGAVCPACEEGAVCTGDADCDSGSCVDGECAPGAGPCDNGNVQCVGNTVQTCEARQWVESEICAQGCEMGACADEVQCTPMENRCFKNSVQVCNAQGTAWQHQDICADECDAGLCVGACEPNALRCNGDTQEICGMDGQTWTEQEVCALGCSHRVCVEAELKNMGVPMTMSGTHVYNDCVTVELGGSIEVPAGETLEMWAKCLEVTSSSYITLNADARFIFHATETIVNAGSIAGGAFVRLDAYQSLTNSGDVSSGRVELRGDELTNTATATIGGTDAYALYGSEWTDNGSHTGAVSVMPPETLSSPTHPEGYQWNMVDDDVSIAWDKPFASVRGYYINVNNSAIPSPSNGEFTTVENVTLPLGLFRPGDNTVQVVSVNADSTVGSEPALFAINFNIATPTVTSSSHGDPFEWSSTDDVFLEWTEASSIDPDSYVGYWYAWDHRGDTRPDDTIGIFRNDDKILFDNQAPGVWMFHISSIDRLGRTSPVPGRYEVRVGPEPGYGNVAGNITDDAGEPLRGATVLLNGGIYRATTAASGDYTFRGEVPAVAFDWEVAVQAPGYVTQLDSVRMTASDVALIDAQLQKNNNPASYELGFPVRLDGGYSFSANSELRIALGRPGEVIWSSPDRAQISTRTGTTLRSIASGNSYAQHIAVGFDGNHYFSARTVYSGGYYPISFRLYDTTHNQLIARTMTGWGTLYGVSVVWDGSRFVTLGGNHVMSLGHVDPNDIDNESERFDTTLSTTTSSTRTKVIYDGAAIAVAVSRSESPGYYVSVGRWSRDGAEVLAPVKLPTPVRNAQPIGLAFDGSSYHVSFKGQEPRASGKYPMFLQAISQSGTLGALTEIATNYASQSSPMVAFDGRNLLVTYETEDRGVFEVRSADDHSLIERFDLGQVRLPNVDFSFQAGGGAVIYADHGTSQGTYMREIIIR